VAVPHLPEAGEKDVDRGIHERNIP
jgi:hypothetical protein